MPGTQLVGLAAPSDASATCDALASLMPRVAELPDRVTDPQAIFAGTPDWPVSELAAHVASEPSRTIQRPWTVDPDFAAFQSVFRASSGHGAPATQIDGEGSIQIAGTGP